MNLDNIILNTNGKIFTCVFVKIDGSERTITARLGVTKHLKGGVSTHNADDFITVFDMNAKDERSSYRVINRSTIKAVTVDGITHTA
jgi:hypothetical protein